MASETNAQGVEPTVCLMSLNGPELGAVQRLAVGKSYTLGRNPSCSLQLDDPLASRVHARIWREGDAWRVADCGSRNGTFINADLIERGELQPGDLIRIGEQMVLFAREETAWPRPQSKTGNDYCHRRCFLARSESIDASREPEGALRKLRQLYRLARQLRSAADLKALVNHTLLTLCNALHADRALLCRADAARQLEVYSSQTPKGDVFSPHILSGWVTQRREALLVELNENFVRDEGSGRAGGCVILAAPVPNGAAPRAAIECFLARDSQPLAKADLDFIVAVARLLGLAWDNLELRQRSSSARVAMRTPGVTTQILGDSPPVMDLLEQISRVAPTDSTVLALGESGTGKELVAQEIHKSSQRADGPFIAVNCAAYNESLLESELFGHEKGAFTGADSRRLGQFERADKGTIFLDEVGELSASCQAKLLRLLEGQPFERLGGVEPIQVDVRIVAATNRNLLEMVQRGEFREDLWYRLRVIELRTPPLRERGDDVIRLATHFLQCYHEELGRGPLQFSEDAIRALRRHSWPGNIRELKNAVERAAVLEIGDEVTPHNLGLAETSTEATCEPATLAENEQRHIESVLAMVGGNKTEACKILGIGRATLYGKLNRLRR